MDRFADIRVWIDAQLLLTFARPAHLIGGGEAVQQLIASVIVRRMIERAVMEEARRHGIEVHL